MGYTTDFMGFFSLDKPLKKKHAKYLKAFNRTRRMKRDASLTEHRTDKLRTKVGLNVGVDGEYFVGEGGFAGQRQGQDVIDGNSPPSTQPGLWCQWTVGDEFGGLLSSDELDEKGIAQTIVWDEGEKFYEYVRWLQYIIDHFLKPWGYTLNGTVRWSGEEVDDVGKIIVENNIINTETF